MNYTVKHGSVDLVLPFPDTTGNDEQPVEGGFLWSLPIIVEWRVRGCYTPPTWWEEGTDPEMEIESVRLDDNDVDFSDFGPEADVVHAKARAFVAAITSLPEEEWDFAAKEIDSQEEAELNAY